MRKLRNYFVMLTMAILAMCVSSCSGEDDDERLGDFVEYTNPQTFYDTYVSYPGTKYLIDTRSASEYSAGHLTDAINLPATVYNTESDDAQWCKDLVAATNNSKNVCLFFYGQSSFEMVKATAGRASRIGYGKENSRIFSKKYDELKTVWK